MELSDDLNSLKLEDLIFKDIKFYVTGEIHGKILELLKDGGAERMNYFTDYVTHLICGDNPEENDLSDANDLYEVPALTSKWVVMSARLKKLVNQKPYLYNPNKLFSNCVFCFSKINEDRNSLWAIITYYGGVVQLNLNKWCTHLITTATDSAKYVKAMELGPDVIKIATPDWIIESVKSNGFVQIELYHPKLINWPKVTKYESTTAITGFEPPPSESEENLPETNMPDSTTQALLDKLKQRMPWNQPQNQTAASSSSNDIVPPNVVAPTSSKIPQTPPANSSTPTSPTVTQQSLQQTQQRLFNPTSQQLIQNQQQIPQFSSPSQMQQGLLVSNHQVSKSVVHHTPQGSIIGQPRPQLDVHLQQTQFSKPNQQMNVSQVQANQLIQNRLLHQKLQQRHILGQIGQINKLNQLTQLTQQNQFNQQLLQQRAQGQQIGQPAVRQLSEQPNVQISQSPQPNPNVAISQQQLNQNQQSLIQRMHLGQLTKNSISMQQLNQHLQQHFANRQQSLGINQLSQSNQIQHLNLTQQVATSSQQITQNQLNQGHQQQLLQNQGSPFSSVPQSPQQINQAVLSPQNQQNMNIQQNKLIQNQFNQQNLQNQINMQNQQVSQSQQQILTPQQQIININQLRQKQYSQNQQFGEGNQRTLVGFSQQQQNQQNQLIQSQQQNQLIQNQQQNQLLQNQQQNQLIQNQQQTQLIQNQQQNQLIQNQQQLIQNQQQNQIIQNQQQNQLQQNQLLQNQQQNKLLQNQQQNQLIQNQQQNQLVQNEQRNQLIQNQQSNQLIPAQQQNQLIQNPQQTQLVQGQQVQFVQTQQFNQSQQSQIPQNPPSQNLIPQSPQPNQFSQSQQNQFIPQNQTQIQQQRFVQNQKQEFLQNQQNQFIQNQQSNQMNQPQPQQINNQQIINQQLLNQQQGVNQQQQLLINQQQSQVSNNIQQQTFTQSSVTNQINQANQFNQPLLQSSIASQLSHTNQVSQQITQQSQMPNQNIVSQITQQSIGPQIGQQNLPPQNLTQQSLPSQISQQNIPTQLAQQNLQNQQNLVGQVAQQTLPNQLVQQNIQNIPAQQLAQQTVQPQQLNQPNIQLQGQLSQPNLPGQQRPIGQHLWQQVGIRHAAGVLHQQQAGPRVQWPASQQSAAVPQRHYIQLDAQTHQQLQQMAPEQRALFIAKLQQRQRHTVLQQKQQQQQLQMQQQQRHVVIRVPSGLTPQQQVQWLQQQAKQQGVVLQQASIQQQPAVAPTNLAQGATVQQNIQQAPGLSPIQQNPSFAEQAQQQIQLRQQFRLQQLQVQREPPATKPVQQIQQEAAAVPQPNIVRPIVHPQPAETVPVTVVDATAAQQQLVVNAKTKTALANMLSIRLQSGGATVGPGPENIAEPSAAGTLRLMTAQHNAALNSTARPQDILALQQRRALGAPNPELVRPPAAPSVPPPPVGEPTKFQYSPRSNIPLQHRPGPFYGHNPNLKLPPDLFLLGCIFVVVEVERFLEELMPNWKQKIEKYGGEVESQYCSRVTHVLCETQRHGVVMQALRDYKRCVTLYWLSDILKRKQVLPPWTALHLPTIYLDTAPASKHLISLSGFVEPERSKIKHMIKYIGATFTSYFSKHNTLLIAAKAEGEKYLHAKKWGTPVVNIQWLTDVMLGHFSALTQIEHIKYQQFPNPPVFTFDPGLVPSLMQAWKMPINISQESYERVKRCVSPVTMPKKTKKLKTEHNDENENPEDFGNPNATHKVLFSTFQNFDELKKIVRDLGGAIAKTPTECTHLVMPTLSRTNKLLHCLCLGTVHIVPESWLWDSAAAEKFLDESNYSFDTKDFNSEYKCDFNQTLATKNRNKLFDGKFFFITPSVYPTKRVLAELIQGCGGVVERIRRTTSQIEATNLSSPYSYIILTHENDLHLVYDVLRNKKDKVKIVCNVELILSAILRQTFEVEPYTVKVL